MASDGQIVFEITADNRDALSALHQTTRVVQEETRRWSEAGDEATGEITGGFSSMLSKIGAAIAAAKIGQKLLSIGREAISLASDLEEVQNVVDVTFGRDSGKIDAWAKNAAAQFGLTETQAKKFTSTLGAMMKSSGLAGSEITDMSTDLAGLAADMASFYNLDFEEAFQKIRAGISGETEPLKQLGINMSVANLNAFALEKGLKKTFDQMDQGEQVMLRYQYLMSATADAQGDFARTSDGYANSVRQLETNINNLKVALGERLLDPINNIVSSINSLFGVGGGEGKKKFSIIDQINGIEIDKEAKIAEITAIASEAKSLIDSLEKLGGPELNSPASKTLEALAAGANVLGSDSAANWTAILGALSGINGLDNLFGEGNAGAQNVSDLAQALAGNSLTTSKAQAWETFLSALSDNAEAVSALTGTSASETKAWLDGMAESAAKLDPNDAAAWNTLMSSLVSGIDMNTEEGQAFVQQLAASFLAMGTESAEAAQGLAALGFSTEEIEDKQLKWLAVCKELTQIMPGISDLIDMQTGEVKGGLPALTEYVETWEKAQKIQAEMEAYSKEREIYEAENNLGTKKAEMYGKRAVLKARMQFQLDQQGYNVSEEELERMIAAYEKLAYYQELTQDAHFTTALDENGEFLFSEEETEMYDRLRLLAGVLSDDVAEAYLEYNDAIEKAAVTEREAPVVLEQLTDKEEELRQELGMTEDEFREYQKSLEAAAPAMTKLEKAASGDADAIEEVENAVNGANEALKEMADYAESVHNSVASAIDSVAKSLDGVDYQAYGKQIEKISELTAKQAQYDVGSDEWKQLQAEIDKVNESLITNDNIYKNLESQATFLDEYLANMEKAREMGLSDELLAELSDGSVQSAEYLAALVNDKTGKSAEEIDALYGQIQEKKKALAKELGDQQLTVDKTYQALAEKAKEAVDALNLEDEASKNSGKTIQGIATGISEKIPEVKEAVDGIISELARLNGYGIDIDFGGFGNITFTTSTGETEGSGRMGIPFVPHDDYIARLHQGERVLTAQENQMWNALRNGGIAGFDMETLGGVMRDNVKPGGNVYLDGRVVGSVISDQQGKSYRQLQRSGWQG